MFNLSHYLRKRFTTHIFKTFILSLFAFSYSSYAAGLMTPIGQNTSLEIREHHVNVVIENGYAITTVEQVFYNASTNDIEANYSFPIPEKAAVGEFTYWIDGQAVTGEVLEKKKAKQIYEEEKQAGRNAAITEQDSYKTFDISVSTVRAQQDARIKLTYIQPTHIDTSIGRYVYPLEAGGTDEQKLSFWTANEKVTEKFSFNLRFRSAYPVEQFRLPQHPQAVTTQISDKEWSVSIINFVDQNYSSNLNRDESINNTQMISQEGTDNSSTSSVVQKLDKDIVVYWRHKSGLPGAVDMITYKKTNNDRGTFMLTLTPGDDLANITEGRDWIFVLDYSGSMSGKYQSMVEGINKGLHKLNSNDRFRIVIFSNRAYELTKGYVEATPENVSQSINILEKQKPDSSTNLYDGLKKGINLLDDDRSSAIILITDGVANVGTTQKKDFLSLMEQSDVRLFTFVMGNSANRPLLEEMTRVSKGFAVNISNSDDIAGKLLEATSKLSHEAFHDVDLDISGVKVTDVTPEKIGTLYRGQQLVVFGHYWPKGEKSQQNIRLSVKGKISGKPKTYNTEFSLPNTHKDTNNGIRNVIQHPEIERLWAYAKIEDLEDKMAYFGSNADTEQAITDIALEYGLVTNYTSMIVLQEEQFTARGIDRQNATRVKNEQQAQTQRNQAATQSNRVDQHKPMYQSTAPSHSGGGSGGGGSFNPLLLILLLPLSFTAIRRKRI